MHRIMEELHQDHVNINRLLKLLELELGKIVNDGDPDLELMIEIIDYVENYPDLVHHPREDVVYRAFKSKTVDATEIVNRLLDEHEQMPELTKEFRLLLEEVENSSIIISREELRSKAQAYIDAQRSHLNTEEALIFPMIIEKMDDEDWDILERSLPVSSDPLFDAEIDRYNNILEHLKTCSAEPA